MDDPQLQQLFAACDAAEKRAYEVRNVYGDYHDALAQLAMAWLRRRHGQLDYGSSDYRPFHTGPDVEERRGNQLVVRAEVVTTVSATVDVPKIRTDLKKVARALAEHPGIAGYVFVSDKKTLAAALRERGKLVGAGFPCMQDMDVVSVRDSGCWKV